MAYTIDDHSHRLAAWQAATAARASKLCRFNVRTGVRILEASGFNGALTSPEQLPRTDDIDRTHKEWRDSIIDAAKAEQLFFTHGIAAKLINCYLKDRFICAGHHSHERVSCLHPPIDELLLKELARHNVGGFAKEWRQFRQKRWSKFDSETYQSVIDLIRVSLAGQPLWMIEQYWEGYQ